jgi:hypothetical protein
VVTNVENFLITCSRIAKLCIQYIRCVSFLKLFIEAERTCNWNLRLYALSQMLPLLAATGHNNYAKVGRQYLQIMQALPATYLQLYNQFTSNKNHAIRKSNKYWAGLPTDLAIEQLMMKPLKSSAGLIHKRGLTDNVREMWVSTMHHMAAVHAAVNSLLDLDHLSDDLQHKESGKSHTKHDNADITKTVSWFQSRNPSDTTDSRLHSLWTGVAAGEDDITCDSVMDVGVDVLTKLDEANFTDVVMRKTYQVSTLPKLTNKASAIGKIINIEASVLFNRLLIIMTRTTH